jgi:hypothetical protein
MTSMPTPRRVIFRNWTPAQLAWIKEHVGYECIGKPRPGVTYHNCGILKADGTFEPIKTLAGLRLPSADQAMLVGVAMIPPPF